MTTAGFQPQRSIGRTAAKSEPVTRRAARGLVYAWLASFVIPCGIPCLALAQGGPAPVAAPAAADAPTDRTEEAKGLAKANEADDVTRVVAVKGTARVTTSRPALRGL